MDFKFVNEKVIKNLVRARKIKLPTKELDIAEDLKWNAKKINSELLQSIQAGESIPKLAKRLQTVTDMNKKAAIRNARTMCTSAQNVGRVNSMKDLQKQGMDVKKKWIATMDSRTRDTHLALHGKIVNVNESFKSGLKYPGDPNGKPGEVYNCRCTIGYVVDDDKFEGNTSTSPIGFKKSNTIEEAESYLKEKTGITANYKGMDLDYANAVNNEVIHAKNVFGDKLALYDVASSETNFEVLDDSTIALYNPETETITFKPMTLSEMRSISSKEYNKGWFSTNNPYHTIRHELGHSVGRYYVIKDNGITEKISNIMDKEFYNTTNTKELAKKLSNYAVSDNQEFIAESVAEYLNGEPRILAKKVVDILIKG